MKIKPSRTEANVTQKIIEAAVLAKLGDFEREPIRNGVKEPGKDDANREIWDAFNELSELGAEPTVRTARKLAARMAMDANSAVVTFHMWKKYIGQN